MQRVIFRKDSKALNVINGVSVFTGENYADYLEILLPLEYEEQDLSQCNVRLAWSAERASEGGSFLIDEYKQQETYENRYYVYLVPITTRLTSETGRFKAYLSITKTISNEEQYVLKTGSMTLIIKDHALCDSELDEHELELLDQVVVKSEQAYQIAEEAMDATSRIQAEGSVTLSGTTPSDAIDVSSYFTFRATNMNVTVANRETVYIRLYDDDNVQIGSDIRVYDGSYRSIAIGEASTIKLVQTGSATSTKIDYKLMQGQIDEDNPLDADLVKDNTSVHKFVTADDKLRWNGEYTLIRSLDLSSLSEPVSMVIISQDDQGNSIAYDDIIIELDGVKVDISDSNVLIRYYSGNNYIQYGRAAVLSTVAKNVYATCKRENADIFSLDIGGTIQNTDIFRMPNISAFTDKITKLQVFTNNSFTDGVLKIYGKVRY